MNTPGATAVAAAGEGPAAAPPPAQVPMRLGAAQRVWQRARQLQAQARAWVSASLARRIVCMSLGLLLVIQLAAFAVIDASLRHHARQALPEQLTMGARVLDSLVGWRAGKLTEAARLLAADYGFRSAVQSQDRDTIASVLANHGDRIGAVEAVLLDPQFGIVAVAEGMQASAATLPQGPLAWRAVANGIAGAFAVVNGQPRQRVLVPLKAPALVGYVQMGFALPEALADEVHKLTAADLTVLARNGPDKPWSVVLSRLDSALAAALSRQAWTTATLARPEDLQELRLQGRNLGVRPVWLLPRAGDTAEPPQNAEVLALLTVSVDAAVAPPQALQVALLVTTLFGFVAFALGSAYTARHVTTPLRALARAAERLGAGDQHVVIATDSRRDEVGELARTFEHMRTSLAATQEQIVQSEKLASIGQLAAGVAHEINNPIGFVFSNFGTLEQYLEQLFKMLAAYQEEEAGLAGTPAAQRLAQLREEIELDYLRDDIPALMSESRDGIKRVRKIVQDLKDFSHVDARQEWEAIDLHAGLDSTLNIVNNEIKYKADVVREYATLPPVECLPHELNQVFMNLMVNAAHAIGDARGCVTLRTGLGAGPGTDSAEVWVEVADNGSGITPENLKRIFDPFFTTKGVGKGTGLGLSLSYGIVKKHGGRIEVASTVGVGTSFKVHLPVRRALPASAPLPSSLPSSSTTPA